MLIEHILLSSLLGSAIPAAADHHEELTLVGRALTCR